MLQAGDRTAGRIAIDDYLVSHGSTVKRFSGVSSADFRGNHGFNRLAEILFHAFKCLNVIGILIHRKTFILFAFFLAQG